MVVCKCHKATKTYCFVHKIPVCGECICQHPICVVRTYAEWVIDGDHDWPPKCDACKEILQEDQPCTRLGCLHNFHSSCLDAHLKSFPAHTAPAGYRCPACPTPVWPPQHFRDLNAGLPSKIKDAISHAGLASTLLGATTEERPPTPPPPPAFTPVPIAGTEVPHAISIVISNGESEITPADEPLASTSKGGLPASRKNPFRPEKLDQLQLPYDEAAARRKYARRGPAYKQFLRYVWPFWSPQPTLPTTMPRREDEELAEGGGFARRRMYRSSAKDPRNVFFGIAIFSCIATMFLLYYRLIQNGSLLS